MRIPNWFEFALLGFASWRSFQAIAFDTILNRPRRWLLRLGDWQEGDSPHSLPKDYRFDLAKFLTCVYCAGFWISLVWWAAWQIWPHATLIVAAPLALSTLAIGGHKLLSKEEDR